MKKLIIKISFIYISLSFVNPCKAVEVIDKEYFKNKPPITACTFYPEILQGLRSVTEDFEEMTAIKVNVQSVPYELFEMWLQSRFLAGRTPEIMIMEKKQMFWRYGQNGKILNFDAIISRPNIFDKQAGPWKDLFHNLTLNQIEDPAGSLYMLPFSQYGTGYFYNKNIYNAARVKPPETWTEMIDTFNSIKQQGFPAHASTFKNDYITLIWVADRILQCFYRNRIPEINLIRNSDIRFDPYDPASVFDEKINLSEKIVAFEKGIIDPATAPEYREMVSMLYDYAMTWSDDFMASQGDDIYYRFAQAKAASIYNGTWYLSMLDNFKRLIAQVSPEKAFDFGIFLFPKITPECSKFVKAGGIDQNSAVRSFIVVPIQNEKWRQRAGLLFCQYITASKAAQKLFEESGTFDLPAMRNVVPREESLKLMTKQKFASLNITEMQGFDNQSLSETIVLTQLYFMDRINIDEYLKRLSRIHRNSLLRLSKIYKNQLNMQFIKENLGRDFE